MVNVDVETAQILIKALEHLIGSKTTMLEYFPEKNKDKKFMEELTKEKITLDKLKLILA